MKTLTAQTKRWIRVFTLAPVFAVLSLLTTVKGHEMYTNNVQTEPVYPIKQHTRLEQLVQKYEPVVIDLSCKQLVGEERQFKTDSRPQVECYSSVAGVFFWHFRNERGNWQNIYYNKYPTTLTGYMFSNDPGELRIQFRDQQGNTSEYFMTLDTDYKPCFQTKGCLRV